MQAAVSEPITRFWALHKGARGALQPHYCMVLCSWSLGSCWVRWSKDTALCTQLLLCQAPHMQQGSNPQHCYLPDAPSLLIWLTSDLPLCTSRAQSEGLNGAFWSLTQRVKSWLCPNQWEPCLDQAVSSCPNLPVTDVGVLEPLPRALWALLCASCGQKGQ